MRLCWDLSSPTHIIWVTCVAHDCESKTEMLLIHAGTPTDGGTYYLTCLMLRPCCAWLWSAVRTWQVSGWVYPVQRPCCAETQENHKNHATHRVYNSNGVNGVNTTWLHTYIDLTNFCHFLRNKDSKYCFFSCKRCSLRFNNGHLSSFRAYLIFLHRASKALSKAANSFMLVSWSRLLRNIHS